MTAHKELGIRKQMWDDLRELFVDGFGWIIAFALLAATTAAVLVAAGYLAHIGWNLA